MISRSAMIVRPTQRFLEWAAGLYPTELTRRVDDEKVVYLIPAFYNQTDLDAIIEDVFAEVFESELNGWHTDPSSWPKTRDLATFREWFTVEAHSIVEDLCDDEVVEEEVDLDGDD